MKLWQYDAHRSGARRHRRLIRYQQPGAAPGTLAAPAAADTAAATPARISCMRYDRSAADQRNDVAVTDCVPPAADAAGVAWFHLQGLPTAGQLQALGQAFDLHALALEDVINRENRAKFETYDSHQFVVLNYLRRDEQGALVGDQICLFMGPNWLVSIADGEQDPFAAARKRIHGKGKVRSRDAGFLLYVLIDLIVDSGFPLLE